MGLITNEDTQAFRKLLIERINEMPQPFELAFSGGVDSTTILFASLAAGYRPRLLTFHMAGLESSDSRAAREIAEHFDLQLATVEIPSDPTTMVEDVKRVIPHAATLKKTIVQCLIPWLYLYPAMKTNTILSGITADDLYCTQRKIQVELHTHGEQAIEQYRHSYASDPAYTTANILRFASEYGKKNIDIYDDPRVEQFFRRFPAKSLAKPFEKHLSIRAFADYYQQGAWRRKRSSYQVNSGLRDLHDRLLLNPNINPHGHQAVIALYREWSAA